MERFALAFMIYKIVRNNFLSALQAAEPMVAPGMYGAEYSMCMMVSITINGRSLQVKPGTSVAAAILSAGEPSRTSVSGEPRAPLCGMGICMECRATVNGEAQVRTCQIVCADGMEIAAQ